MREIIEFIHDVTNSHSEIHFGAVPLRLGEPDCKADMTKLTDMGFRCEYYWKDGLRNMIKEMVKDAIV